MVQVGLEKDISFALKRISIISDDDKTDEEDNGLSVVSNLIWKVLFRPRYTYIAFAIIRL